MIDIPKENFESQLKRRREKIGSRIKEERKKKYKSQGAFADAITPFLRDAPSQSTISDWETGTTIPEYDKLLAMSFLFGCNVGYLLGDYDQRTQNAVEIHNSIGLSEESINLLSHYKVWGFGEIANVIDILLLDNRVQNCDGKRSYKSIIESLHSFFSYSGGGRRYFVSSNGYIVPDKSTEGMVSVGATIIDDAMIENAILVDIQNALISLKRGMNRG